MKILPLRDTTPITVSVLRSDENVPENRRPSCLSVATKQGWISLPNPGFGACPDRCWAASDAPDRPPLPRQRRRAFANQREALAGVLPLERRDQLMALLTDQDVATQRHLVEQGIGADTLRAFASDLAYLEAWSLALTGSPLPWPAPEGSVMRFIAHRLWDPAQHEKAPERGCQPRSPQRSRPRICCA